MNPKTRAAGCASFSVFFLVALVAVGVLLATLYVTSEPTTGLDLAQRARQAGIDKDQAATALTLSLTSEHEARARALDRQSWMDTFSKFGNMVLVGGACLVGLLIAGTFAFTVMTLVNAVREAQR